jgi:hypothetical protein
MYSSSLLVFLGLVFGCISHVSISAVYLYCTTKEREWYCVYLREHKHTAPLSLERSLSPLSTTVRTPGPTEEEEDTNTDE